MSAASSWAPVPEGSGFGIENLPYGIVSRPGTAPRVAVRIGEHALDLAAVAELGLLGEPPERFATDSLNPFLARGPAAWSAVRHRVTALLRAGDEALAGERERVLLPLDAVTTHLPVAVADFVDFYSSLEHATNLGRLFRPGAEPLLPNWRHLPVGYHGRAGTVVVSGTPVLRPAGQSLPSGATEPVFGPSARLDIELEAGFVVGVGSRLGRPVPVDAAGDHLFGVVLLNDWSARDLQAWEYQPLGPFLGKSFATSISAWVVPLEALEPFRVPGPPQDPAPLPYLRAREPWAFDVALSVTLQSARMRAEGLPPATIARANLAWPYWTAAQQLAHVTVNGASVRTGDLHGTGTISGADAGARGSLIELTWNGAEPLLLPGGERRAFLADGDSVVLSGVAGGGARPLVSLGTVEGTVVPSASTLEA